MKLMGSDSVTIIAGASEDVGSINFAERHPIGVWKVGLYRRLETSYTSTSE